jgi:hypothetical protein
MRILLEVENQKASSLLEVLRSLPFVKARTLPEAKSSGKPLTLSLEKQYRMVQKESNEMLKDYKAIDGENWEDQY